MELSSEPARERGPRPRKGEVIGGGAFVFRRRQNAKRVAPNTLPFEHPSAEAAIIEAKRLAERHPGQTFEVFVTAGAFSAPNSTEVSNGPVTD